MHRQDQVNREKMPTEEDHPHYKTFRGGMDFLEKNHTNDNWFLQLEYFDPHEPYFVPDKYKKLYTDDEMHFDWPYYGEVVPGSKQVTEARTNYRALVSMTDYYLGKVLDFMDDHNLWDDTLLIVNTDHGYLLGEHGYFGKNYMPTYEQLAHTPFFMWDPTIQVAGKRRKQLSQTIDIVPTILDFFSIEKPESVLGHSLRPVIELEEEIHDYILFGYFGKHVNITDGRYVYMRSSRNKEECLLNNYTLLPLHMFHPFSLAELKDATLEAGDRFSFTKGVPVLKIPAKDETSPQNSCYMYSEHMKYGDLLFDLHADPEQSNPIKNPEVEQALQERMIALLKENEAPEELYERIGL